MKDLWVTTYRQSKNTILDSYVTKNSLLYQATENWAVYKLHKLEFPNIQKQKKQSK